MRRMKRSSRKTKKSRYRFLGDGKRALYPDEDDNRDDNRDDNSKKTKPTTENTIVSLQKQIQTYLDKWSQKKRYVKLTPEQKEFAREFLQAHDIRMHMLRHEMETIESSMKPLPVFVGTKPPQNENSREFFHVTNLLQDKKYKLVKQKLQNKEINPNTYLQTGTSLIGWAAANVDLPSFYLLLEYGADVFMDDDKRYNILDVLMINANTFSSQDKFESFYKILKYLLESGLDVNRFQDDEFSPLTLALKYGLSDLIVQLLIDYGADVNQRDGKGHTPLQYAIVEDSETDDSNFVQVLMNAGAKITPDAFDLLLESIESNHYMIIRGIYQRNISKVLLTVDMYQSILPHYTDVVPFAQDMPPGVAEEVLSFIYGFKKLKTKGRRKGRVSKVSKP